MLTGELRNKVDQVWNAFWSGGIANPIEVIEQITYLLFLRALDSDQTREDNKALRLKTQPVHLIPTGQDAQGRPHDDMRWSRFKNMAPADMFDVLSNQVFPFLRGLQMSGGPAAETAFARHMRDARFTIPRRACWPRWSICSTPFRWTSATPRATCTNTCSARSPLPGKTGNSAHRATSSI